MNLIRTNLAQVESKIFLIRGRKVMLDADLAALYGVETKNLNKAAKRNISRFPDDFMFQLSELETADLLKFQSGTSNPGRGGRRTRPYAFTQEGIAMLSGALHSDRAIQVNIEIMRTFVKLRSFVRDHRDLAQKLAQLESKYDRQFKSVFEAIRELMSTHSIPRKRIIGLGKKSE